MINDQSFRFFCAVEAVVCKSLPYLRVQKTPSVKQTVKNSATISKDSYCQDIDKDLELLNEVIVTFPGFSLAAR